MTVDILLVADGASPHTRRLARALVERDVALEIACFEGSDVPGVREHALGRRPAEDDRRYPLAIPRLARIIAARRPRIVHAHYVSSYGVLATAAHALGGRGARLVQTAWGTDLLVTARRSRVRSALASFALRRADLITGDSDDLMAAAARLAPRVPRRRFVFGPPRALSERVRHPERIVVSARRLDPPMRVPLVISSFRRALEAAPDTLAGWRLLVAGSGGDAASSRHAAEGDPAVELLGLLDQSRLHDLLLRARLFVSVPESDGTSAALLEALAAGVPCVVNDLPANREWIDASVGRIVDRDPSRDALARAMIEAIGDGHDPAHVRARVRDVCWEDQVDALLATLRAL